MIKNSKQMFLNETTGKIRAVANIKNISQPVSENEYSNDDYYYLDDPYEGQLFNWIITLFETANFTQAQIEFIWEDKKKKLKSVNYRTNNGQ